MIRKKVDSKTKKFQFHYEMTTDGVAMSLLFSREVEVKGKTNRGDHCKRPELSEERNTGRHVGIHPGTKNLVTMTDTSGITVMFTCRQRRFEGKLPVICDCWRKRKRKRTCLITQEKPIMTDGFLLRRNSTTNGRHIFVWKRSERLEVQTLPQQKEERGPVSEQSGREVRERLCPPQRGLFQKGPNEGCDPSLGVGMKKVLQKKFDVTEVDEFKTSKTCNLCFGEMSVYVKKDGRRSYSSTHHKLSVSLRHTCFFS